MHHKTIVLPPMDLSKSNQLFRVSEAISLTDVVRRWQAPLHAYLQSRSFKVAALQVRKVYRIATMQPVNPTYAEKLWAEIKSRCHCTGKPCDSCNALFHDIFPGA